MRARERLDKFDEREIANSLGPNNCGNFDRNWNLVVDHFGLELMCVPRKGVSAAFLRGRRTLSVFCLFLLPLTDHLFELFNKHVLGVTGLQNVPLQDGHSWHQRKVHVVHRIIKRRECFGVG